MSATAVCSARRRKRFLTPFRTGDGAPGSIWECSRRLSMVAAGEVEGRTHGVLSLDALTDSPVNVFPDYSPSGPRSAGPRLCPPTLCRGRNARPHPGPLSRGRERGDIGHDPSAVKSGKGRKMYRPRQSKDSIGDAQSAEWFQCSGFPDSNESDARGYPFPTLAADHSRNSLGLGSRLHELARVRTQRLQGRPELLPAGRSGRRPLDRHR